MISGAVLWCLILGFVTYLFIRDSKEEAVKRSSDAFDSCFFGTEIHDAHVIKYHQHLRTLNEDALLLKSYTQNHKEILTFN